MADWFVLRPETNRAIQHIVRSKNDRARTVGLLTDLPSASGTTSFNLRQYSQCAEAAGSDRGILEGQAAEFVRESEQVALNVIS